MNNRVQRLLGALERNREAMQALQQQQADLLDEIAREKTGPEQDEPPLVVAEAAQMLKLSEEYVKRLLRAGDLKGYRAGRKWLIARSELQRFTNERSKQC